MNLNFFFELCGNGLPSRKFCALVFQEDEKMSNLFLRTRILAHTKFLISIGYRSIYLVWFSDCLYCLEYIFYILKMLSLIIWLCNSLTFEFWIRCEFAYCMWFCIWGKLVRYKNYFSVLIIFWKNVVRTAF